MVSNLEEFLDSKEAIELFKLLADRIPEGVVIVDDTYKILYMNRILKDEFSTSNKQDYNVVGKSYFDFFFKPGMPEEEKAEHPLYKKSEEGKPNPFHHSKLAKNDYHYDIITYSRIFSPKGIIEIWSRFASKDFVEALKKYKNSE